VSNGGVTGDTLRIGELARIAGVTPRTIRHYESLGLVAAPRRGPGGYREYEPVAVLALAEIRRLRALGMSLSDIAGARHDGNGSLLGRLHELKDDLDRQAAELAARRRALAELESAAAENEAILGTGSPDDFAPVRRLLMDGGASPGAIDEARRIFAALDCLSLPADWTATLDEGLSVVRDDPDARDAWIGALELIASLRGVPVDDPAVDEAARRIASLGSASSDVRAAISFTDQVSVAIVSALASCFTAAQTAAAVKAAVAVGALS
jgi:DNA-binding transcriptional MerR regulator